MKTMQKIMRFIFLIILIANIFPIVRQFVPVTRARSKSGAKSAEIYVELKADGTAEFTEDWDLYIDSGSEFFLKKNKFLNGEIKDFSVSDETGQNYEFMEKWNPYSNMESKKGKCGINTLYDGSIELCWGLGSYEPHKFKLKYKIEDFLLDYGDKNANISKYVLHEMSDPPKKFKLRISGEGVDFTEENMEMWGLGFYGKMKIEDGDIVLTSSYPFDKDSDCVVALEIKEGTFPNLKKADEEKISDYNSLKNNYLKHKFIKNPKYRASEIISSNQLISVIPSFILVIFIYLFMLKIPFYSYNKISKYYKKNYPNFKPLDKKYRDSIPARPVPPNITNLSAIFSLIKHMDLNPSTDNLMNAYITKWLDNGTIIELETSNSNTFAFKLNHLPNNKDDASEIELYNAFSNVATYGAIDSASMKKLKRKGIKLFEKWEMNVAKHGNEYLENNGYCKNKKSYILLSDKGVELAVEILGFNNFLLKGDPKEVEYNSQLFYYTVIFGILFSIPAQRIKNFTKIMPKNIVNNHKYYIKTRQYNVSKSMRNNTYRSSNSSGSGGSGGGSSRSGSSGGGSGSGGGRR